MDRHAAIESLKTLIAPERLAARLSAVDNLIDEDITQVIPSFVLGQDGIALASLHATSDSYLVEIRTPAIDSDVDFDVAALGSIKNYRVKTWTHQVKEGEEVKAEFAIATIDLFHSFQQFMTKLEYVGNARAAWIADAMSAIKLANVLKPL